MRSNLPDPQLPIYLPIQIPTNLLEKGHPLLAGGGALDRFDNTYPMTAVEFRACRQNDLD